jgi:hypothetical protein
MGGILNVISLMSLCYNNANCKITYEQQALLMPDMLTDEQWSGLNA